MRLVSSHSTTEVQQTGSGGAVRSEVTTEVRRTGSGGAVRWFVRSFVRKMCPDFRWTFGRAWSSGRDLYTLHNAQRQFRRSSWSFLSSISGVEVLETKAFTKTEKVGDKEQYTAAVGATETWYLVLLVSVLIPQTSIIGGRRSRRI